MNLPSMRCVGYRQVLEYLQGEYDYSTMRDKGIAATRQLAKRQLTWLRHWDDALFYDPQNVTFSNEIIAKIREILDNEPFLIQTCRQRNIMLKAKKEPASAKKNYVVHQNELPLSCPTDAMELMECSS